MKCWISSYRRFYLRILIALVFVLSHITFPYQSVTSIPKSDENHFLFQQDLYFIENAGQWQEEVKFAFLGQNVSVLFLQNSVQVVRHSLELSDKDITFSLANSYSTVIQGVKKLPFTCSYIQKKGNCEAKAVREIIYLNAWKGIDIHFFFLDYRLTIQILSRQNENNPPVSITIIQKCKNPLHEKLFFVPLKESPLFFHLPTTKSFDQSLLKTSFQLNLKSIQNKELSYYLLDEIFVGAEEDEARSFIVLDSTKVYIAGDTNSPDLSEEYQVRNKFDVFILLYDLNKKQVQKIIFLTGSGNDYKPKIFADQNRIFVSGNTYSSDLFPKKSDSYQAEHAGGSDVFIAVFSEDLQTLEYSSYFGGTGNDFIEDIVIFNEKLVLSGTTTSEDFPKPSRLNNNNTPFQPVLAGDRDIFISVLSEDITSLEYSTYYGGSGIDEVMNIALHDEELYLVGCTYSKDFHAENAYDIEFNDDVFADGFIIKWNLAKNNLNFSTFIGGSNKDGCVDIVVQDDKILVVGTTDGSNLPSSVTALQRKNAGKTDIFFAILPDNGRELLYLTYLGGEGIDICHDLAIDNFNNIIIAGETTSTSFGKRVIEHQGSEQLSDCIVFQISSDLNNVTDIHTAGGSHGDAFWRIHFIKDALLLLGTTNSDDIILEESFSIQANRLRYTGLNFFLTLINLKDTIEAPIIEFHTKETESYQNKFAFKGKITDRSTIITQAMISVNNSEKEPLILSEDGEFNHEILLNNNLNIISVEAWNMFEVKSSKSYTIKRLFIPNPPEDCDFSQYGDYILLSWEMPEQTSYPIQSFSIKKYLLQINQEKNLIFTQSVDQNSFQDSNITVHESYIYVLQSIDSVGKRSVDSKEFMAKIADFSPPTIQITSELITSTEEEKMIVNGIVADNESGVSSVRVVLINDKYPSENPLEITTDCENKKQDSFEFALSLQLGGNYIQIIAENGDGFKVHYPEEKWELKRNPVDKDAPFIEIDPIPGTLEHYNPVINVTGHVKDKQNKIDRCTVNKTFVDVQVDGSFSAPVKLQRGVNVILIEAWDINQNHREKEIKIDFTYIRLIKLTIGSSLAFVDGEKKLLDVSPVIINSRTLVPLRFIGENLDSTVEYLDFSKFPDYSNHEILIGKESNWYQLYVNQKKGFIQSNRGDFMDKLMEPRVYVLPADCSPRLFSESPSVPYLPLSWIADSLDIIWSAPSIEYLPAPTNEVKITWGQKLYHFWFDKNKEYQALIEYVPELNKSPRKVVLKHPPIFDSRSNVLMFLSLEDTARLFGYQYRYRQKTPSEIRISRFDQLIRIWIQETESLLISLNQENKSQVRLIRLDTPPQIKQSRTLVPIRFITETIGAKVDWNQALKEITIKLPISKQ